MSQSSVAELYTPPREHWENVQKCYFTFQSQQEEVKFENENDNQFYFLPPASADFTTDSSPEELGDFLKRPSLIRTISWLPAGVSDADFDPWSLFLDLTPIKKKLDNFAFFRGNLHIKAVVNASPFYYGAMMINYTPTPANMAQLDNSYVSALIPQSQKPHIWIDLRSNLGGEMILPFIYPTNYADLNSSYNISRLGYLRNITYVGLASANGATVNGVTVKIYAWMEDVQLTGNTTKLALQAKKQVADEFGNGPVSRPASALAHWASYLVNVPIIGQYAKATQIGASAVSSVAGLFGWSKVPVIDNVKPVKPMFMHDLASAHISEPMSKFTLDPKAELSIDPRIVSSHTGEDELSISNIVQKDSFLGSVVWNTNDVLDTLLFSARVNPCMHNRESFTSGYIIGATPMAYIGRMFDSWRGDIIFTFKIVCSQYHRGRLRIHWDPLGSTSIADLTNETLTKIVDIGIENSVEFRVPYVSYRMWLYNRALESENNWSVNSTVSPAMMYDNGGIYVRVLNKLSAPIDTAPVTMMIFVRGAENLEFADPIEIPDHLSFFETQSLVEDATDTQQKSTPLDERYLINWGEPIPSLRLIMQRSCLYESVPLIGLPGENPSAVLQQFSFYFKRYPSSHGYDQVAAYTAKGVITPPTTYYFNYCHNTPVAWISPMFAAKRGSIQWHFQLEDNTSRISSMCLDRNKDVIATTNAAMQIGTWTTLVSTGITYSAAAKLMRDYSYSAVSGVVVTPTKVNPTISAELPQMCNARYVFTGPQNCVVGTSEDGSYYDTYRFSFKVKPDVALDSGTVINKYVNAGTDFSLNFFVCTPHIYYASTAGGTPV